LALYSWWGLDCILAMLYWPCNYHHLLPSPAYLPSLCPFTCLDLMPLYYHSAVPCLPCPPHTRLLCLLPCVPLGHCHTHCTVPCSHLAFPPCSTPLPWYDTHCTTAFQQATMDRTRVAHWVRLQRRTVLLRRYHCRMNTTPGPFLPYTGDGITHTPHTRYLSPTPPPAARYRTRACATSPAPLPPAYLPHHPPHTHAYRCLRGLATLRCCARAYAPWRLVISVGYLPLPRLQHSYLYWRVDTLSR